MSNIEAEKSSVIKSLRACLISAQGGIPVTHLNRDYQQLLGEYIPFHRLGYTNLEDFLKSVPDISVHSKAGVYYVQAKKNENTASLISLVQGQKRSAPRKKIKPAKNVIHIKQNRPPRYRRRPTAPAAPPRPVMKKYDPEYLPTRTVIFKHEKNNFTIDENKNVRIDPQLATKKPLLPTPMSQPVNRLHQYLAAEPTESKTSLNNSSFLPNENKVSSVPYKHSISLDNKSAPSASKVNRRLQKNKSTSDLPKSSPSKSDHEVVTSAPESKLSNRLKQASHTNLTKNSHLANEGKAPVINKNVSFASPPSPTGIILQAQPCPPRQSAQSRLEKTRILPPPESKLVVVVDTQEGNKTCFYQSKLSAYVLEQNWPKEPSYVVYQQKSGKRVSRICYACTVRVAIPRQSFRLPEEIFECSTFPIDFLTQAESKEYAASQALEKLKEREVLMNAPIVSDTSVIIERIKKFVENKDSGIWAQKIEDEYKSAYQQLLPNYWVDIIKVAEQFEVEELGPSYIIRFKDRASSSSNASEVSGMPTLTFPSETTWDVFITAGTSVTNVHLRFIGDEYSTRFDMFSASMESWYENVNNRVPAQLSVGKYCAAYYGKSWWRVIITNLEDDNARIKFIDHGDEEKINQSNLYQLESRFFRLPPQAVSVSLKGLEEFAGRKEGEDFLVKTIIGKSLVGVVETFLPTLKKMSLTLYDTSSEEAANLNESLRHLFELDYKHPPRLELGSVHELTVTNVELDGRVHIQVFNDGLALLQEFIDFYEEIDFESVTDYSQIKLDKIYLALQHDDNLYYRVKPLNSRSVDAKVQVYCIDYGKCCSVFLEDLVHMENSSYLLEQIPGQAIAVTLHDIPPSAFTPSIKDKLRELVSGDPAPVIVGRVRDVVDGIPVVELFRRTVPDNLLVSINQTLVVEENIQLTTQKLDWLQLSPKRICIPSVAVQPDQLPPERIHIPPVVQTVHLSSPGMHSVIRPKKTSEIIGRLLTAYPARSIERILSQNRPELPDIDEYFTVYVHSTVSPSHFLINPSDYVASLNKVMDEMNSYYNTNKVQTILEEGSLCAAKDGNYWYRAYIDKVIDLENVSVKVIDYGCVKIIPSNNVKPLLDIFTKHPYIGFSAKIHGIVPAHGDWSVEDSITMKNLINKKTIRTKLKDIVPNKLGLGGMTLSLELHATDYKGQEFHVAEHFVREYNAKFE